ncbi:SusD/RagB family nutrient-binding outer membrane lipoprotein [Lutibacter citreus]|uniref:SusD/RagB family nutrient-binding outer membrane lipoprotein n=1 Tax=Lutibacter citreus TaxID=2138210 RepID=UPI000DBE83B3|nr:SusD/RagB family nutrient-binding outer membrane lipoprotein [Lutibacter citreus]
MKLHNYLILILIAITSSCSDDYFDVNGSETKPTTSSLAPQYRIQGAIENTTAQAQYRGSREVLGITQYGSQNTANYYSETWSSSLTTGRYFLWQNAYVYSLPNTADLIVLGERDNSPNFVAVGKILRSYILGMTTDQYGDIVLNETYDGVSSMNITPKFSTQAKIYEAIFKYLDEAIVALDETSEIELNEEDGDVLYQGNKESWKKFAYALKARYLNHLSKKSSYDPDAIIAACQLAINSNALNAQKTYGGGPISNDIQPFAVGGYGSSRMDYFSDFFIKLLKNPLNLEDADWDPRLTIIVPEAVNGGYKGVVIGRGLSGDSGDDYSLGNGGFYTSPNSTTDMINFSEVKFIEAEARFRKNDISGAFSAFKAGVQADFEKLGIAPEATTTYLNLLDTEIGEDNLSLSHIMVQKYIANVLNPETWVDMRRMDYSSNIYKGLQRPENVNLDIFPNDNDWIQAMCYEYNEEDRNYENMPNNDPYVRLTTPLWWNTAD